MLRTRSPRKEKISNCYLHSNSLSNKMDNSLLAVRDINHKYIVVERSALCPRIQRDESKRLTGDWKKLPKGTLTYKKINGKEQPYIQRTIDGKSVSYYVKLSEREQVLMELEERTKLLEEKKHLTAYAEELKGILKRNPYLSAHVVIGYQDFEDFTCGQQFYVR